MNRFLLIVFVALSMTLASCSSGYNQSLCEDLSDKVMREEPLSQDDYQAMLSQYEAILKYLISRADDIIDEKDPQKQADLQQQMRNDEEYLQRFSYMFTFGSTLYQAQVNKLLDQKNLNTYNRLDRYADEFARQSEEL